MSWSLSSILHVYSFDFCRPRILLCSGNWHDMLIEIEVSSYFVTQCDIVEVINLSCMSRCCFNNRDSFYSFISISNKFTKQGV